MRRVFASVFVVATLGACAMTPGARDRERALDARLEAAGFHAMAADTPAKKAHLDRMPKGVFSSVVRAGQRRWLLPDPEGCRCLWVGDDAAYRRYANLEIGSEITPSDRAAKLETEDAREVDREMEFLGPYQIEDVFGLGTTP